MISLLNTLSDGLILVIGFGCLIFFHELGHFLAAKWAGIRTHAFAIGFGPVLCSWRQGVGFRVGSTNRDVAKRLGKPAEQINDEALAAAGMGETEYSLRAIPLGGFVKMLGQEDLNPSAVSDDRRSYNTAPFGKRLVVVSAGVIMNILLAMVLFVWAFLAGVRFEAPVVGAVAATAPAGEARAVDADERGITEKGLQPGDRIVSINGDEIDTFADIQVAVAMARPNEPLDIHLIRTGHDEPLRFQITPEKDSASGLLSIGIGPAASNQLLPADINGYEIVAPYIAESGVFDQGVEPGMAMVEANGRPIETFEQFQALVEHGDGEPVETLWRRLHPETGEVVSEAVSATINARPQYQRLIVPARGGGSPSRLEEGLLGLVPMTRVKELTPGSPNRGVLRAGDLVLRIDDLSGPRLTALQEYVSNRPNQSVALELLRDGEIVQTEARLNDDGMLGVGIEYAVDVLMIAEPMPRVAVSKGDGEYEIHPTPVHDLRLPPMTTLLSVDGAAVADWPSFRAALRASTAEAYAAGQGTSVMLGVRYPTPGEPEDEVELALSAEEVKALHDLGWRSALPSVAFLPIQTTLSANGNPITAVVMGVERTHSLIMMTYLTIDRLFRGSVGVEQLRGPIGIAELGFQVLQRGFMYFVFLMGMVSINLAVINFLPLPILDGGLALFIIYERIVGRPPSVQVQNALNLVGIVLIGALFIVVFYNDIARIVS